MIKPIAVGGTSESYAGDVRTEMPVKEVSMLTYVTNALSEEYFEPARWVGYPASYATPMPYEESVGEGIDNLHPVVEDAIAEFDRVALLGYSQGASVVRRYLAKLAAGDYGDPADYEGVIVGAGCVADPYRPEGNALGFEPGGYGLAGKTTVWDGGYLFEVAAHRDPICAAKYNSYLRDVADFTGYMTPDPRKLDQWMKKNIATIKDKGWQNANLDWGQFWLTGQRVNNSIDEAGGYLQRIEYQTMPWLPPIVINPGGGRHTCYGVELLPGSIYTYCETLAMAMNAEEANA